MSGSDSLYRFSDRVDDYVKYRPSYPEEILDFMSERMGFGEGSRVADIGAGTGISAMLFLKGLAEVFAVEPNDKMREAAERLLGGNPKFHGANGTAEKTGLPDRSIDFITAAQAYHWFNPREAKKEFRRILKPDGWVALIWNDRKTEGSKFAVEYENLLLEFGTDYEKVRHKNIAPDSLREFLGDRDYGTKTFFNEQRFDFDGLLGRLTSSSYAPNRAHPRFEEMCEALKNIFERNATNGSVTMEYETRLYYSRL